MTATSAVQPSTTGTVRNPATGDVAGEVHWTDPADVPRIAEHLAQVQHDWEARGAKGRAKVLSRFAVWLGDHHDEIEDLLIKETGKSRTDAIQEVPMLVIIISYLVKIMEQALAPETRPAPIPALAVKKISVHYRPRPVVGIIAPWNFPVANALMDALGALAAGCAVLLKPSERTPLTAEVVGRGARRLTPVSLELGGKDPMIVLDDADVDLAAHAAVWGGLFNAGEMCVSVERVYVLDSVYDRFVDAVVSDVKALQVGAGDGPHFGSMIDEGQLAVVEKHVADATAKGARVLTGGERIAGEGSFYQPTVLVDVDHSMECMTAETFGPTLPIMKVGSAAEAVKLANDSLYGLSASVFSGDVERAKEIALQLDCGAVNVNDVVANLMCTTAPMGGWKESGIGARFGGADTLRKYCRVETVVEPRVTFGAGANYYSSSPKAAARMAKQMMWMALRRPRRIARDR